MKRTNRMVRALCGAYALVLLGSCQATVGVSAFSIPANAAQTCAGHCQSIGMRLSAVAIMADNVGCVCQYPSEPKAGAATSSAGDLATPAAGMATIAVQQAAASRRRR